MTKNCEIWPTRCKAQNLFSVSKMGYTHQYKSFDAHIVTQIRQSSLARQDKLAFSQCREVCYFLILNACHFQFLHYIACHSQMSYLNCHVILYVIRSCFIQFLCHSLMQYLVSHVIMLIIYLIFTLYLMSFAHVISKLPCHFALYLLVPRLIFSSLHTSSAHVVFDFYFILHVISTSIIRNTTSFCMLTCSCRIRFLRHYICQSLTWLCIPLDIRTCLNRSSHMSSVRVISDYRVTRAHHLRNPHPTEYVTLDHHPFDYHVASHPDF